jgi:hypothetical protein
MVGARSRASVAAGILFGLAAAEVAMAIVFGFLSPLSWAELVDLLVVSNAILGLALAVAGWPIAVYRPRNLIGWSLLAGGCCWASTGAGIALLAWAAVVGHVPADRRRLGRRTSDRAGAWILRIGHAADCGCLQPSPGLVATQGRAGHLRCSP